MTEQASSDVSSGIDFRSYLLELEELEQIGSDDLVGLALPLLEQVIETHQRGDVAPLQGVSEIRVSLGHLWYQNSASSPETRNARAVRSLDRPVRSADIELTRRISIDEAQDDSADGDLLGYKDSRLADRDDEDRVAYYPDYVAWEHRVGHHDALSDTFVLGLMMGSLITGLDLTSQDDLALFLEARDDFCKHNPRLSPVIARVVRQMTELSRHDRPQDLETVAKAIANYRFQDVEDQHDLSGSSLGNSRRSYLLDKLRSRLFEVSRRNRLLYFRETGGTVNLTEGSVPNVINVESIRPQQLLFTNESVCTVLRQNAEIPLERWLRFEDYPFLAGALDRVRLQANREKKEFGFSQLRLVTAFLRWHNLKDAPDERINSPLILVPATLTKRKGVKDQFQLRVSVSEAEINPALRHHLSELYGLVLPESVDAGSLEQLHGLVDSIRTQLVASDKGVELELVDKPRIQLIKRKAARRLDRYRRKLRKTGRGLKGFQGLSYAYHGARYEPLGVQIFARDVRPANAPRREMAELTSGERVIEEMSGRSATLEREFFALDGGESKGSHQWEVDLCSVTLANFSYRKMTLVRDYTELAAQPETDQGEQLNFGRLFNEEVRPTFAALNRPALAERYAVLPTDPSQETAVLRARQGDSYVIQGPPGTGKSQTITNLIVDFVARGQSVLFVCEKRAALDVVYHRLEQVGISDACCLIHDTREDKKPFIQALKTRYERSVEASVDANLSEQRSDWVSEFESELQILQRFSESMVGTEPDPQNSLRGVIGRWIERGVDRGTLDLRLRGQLPSWDEFAEARVTTEGLRDVLSTQGYAGVLARSPARYLRSDLHERTDHLDFIEASLERISTALQATSELPALLTTLLPDQELGWAQTLNVVELVRRIVPFAEAETLSALDPTAPLGRRAKRVHEALAERSVSRAHASEAASCWRDPLNVEDAEALLAVARQKEGRFFAFFSSGWRSARSLVRSQCSDASLSVTEALELLCALQEAERRYTEAESKFLDELGLDNGVDVSECQQILHMIGQEDEPLAAEVRDVFAYVASEDAQAKALFEIAGNQSALMRAERELQQLYSDYHAESAERLSALSATLSENVDACDLVVHELASLSSLQSAARQALRGLDLLFDDLEACVLEETIRTRLRSAGAGGRFSAEALDRSLSKLAQLSAKGHELNGAYAVSECLRQFHAHLARSSASMVGTSQEEKDWRRAYARGRKTLEREFAKTRAYRSVRELFAGESGPVLRDLRPVWLMSPLSVADALPLDETLFDVVIFDEASQIPLEDAIPTINRARQMIVVGDDMQLPPTRFFSGRSNADEESDDRLPDVIRFDLNASSFLTRASAALPGTLLAWHYRSKHESLIGFCNSAFYGGQLKTIPTPGRLKTATSLEIDMADSADALVVHSELDRPISYHRLRNSPYTKQRNSGEALYIAHLVRELLKDETQPTVGIVAFSQAQQTEIESALDALASEDSSFRTALDAEEEREEDDQFVGLFVKNLENVQGDERDVIILSVCYGPNKQGRMIMNFGPINQSGGHKRLNVIFSRAKRNMMVISSIAPEQITNTDNQGANALRRYLQYAQAVSCGDTAAMSSALSEYGSAAPSVEDSTSARSLQQQVGDALTGRGLEVAYDYGQSELRCHLAVKTAGTATYQLAILIDDNSHYAIDDVLTRYASSSSVLSAFGWKVTYVLGKDWYEDRDAVVERLLQLVASS